MKKKNKSPSTFEEAGKKAVKQITAVIAAGLILMAADMILTSSENGVEIVEKGGRMYMMRPDQAEEAGRISLTARASGEDSEFEKKVDVVLEPYGSKTGTDAEKADDEAGEAVNETEQMEYEIRGIVSDFNSDPDSKMVEQPSALESGETLTWEVRKNTGSDLFLILMLTMITAFCVYRNRFAAIEKRRREERESVLRQLPEFVNRLVLLLNAGMVLTGAFEKAVEESFSFSCSKDDYFYGKLKDIYIASKTANASMNRELRRMAKESGIRELMRVSNIINDNINKGVELTDKLQAESEILWLNRKKSCEEKGRFAETKMTLPLMLFLMVLIIITVAPALLEL